MPSFFLRGPYVYDHFPGRRGGWQILKHTNKIPLSCVRVPSPLMEVHFLWDRSLSCAGGAEGRQLIALAETFSKCS